MTEVVRNRALLTETRGNELGFAFRCHSGHGVLSGTQSSPNTWISGGLGKFWFLASSLRVRAWAVWERAALSCLNLCSISRAGPVS